jgi:hypothetical protein
MPAYIKRISLIVLLLLNAGRSWCGISEGDLVKKADLLFGSREYEMAYDYYLKLKALAPEKLLYEYRAGVCAIYNGDGATALGFLTNCLQKDTNLTDINFFLGRAYLMNEKPEEARGYFKKQITKEPLETERTRLQFYVNYCNNAIDLLKKPVNATVANMGRPLNSPGDEYSPLILPGDVGMLFTYKGVQSKGGKQYILGKSDSAGFYLEDVLESRVTKNGWSNPLPLSDSVNTKMHDASAAISPDGNTLYIFRSSAKSGGDIYACKKRGMDWSKPEKLKGAINSPQWDGSITFSTDGRTAYFASDRPGGYGGKDLYRATLQDDGTWGNVQNLGPNINTQLDDDAPSLFSDGRKMAYASKGQNSMGGYDIFFAELLADNMTWNEGKNAGYPINSTVDDIYYVVGADGVSAMFSSNRTGGNGGMDLYIVEPGEPAKANEIVLIKGTITLDDIPAAAAVSVTTGSKDSLYGDYKSNKANGRYAVSLPPGSDYKITFIMSGNIDSIRQFNATDVKSFVSKEFDVAFYTDAYKRIFYERFGIKDTSELTRRLMSLAADSMTMPTGQKMVMRRDSSTNYQNEDGSEIAKGLFIVIGSFRNVPYAKRLQEKIKTEAKYPSSDLIYNRKNKFTYVVVAHPKDPAEAAVWVAKARQEYADAWVQKLD